MLDGVMQTALIILAAVVALIVIVVVLGMRYLRPDDDDEPDYARGRPSRPGHDRDRLPRERPRPSAHDYSDSRAGQSRRNQPLGADRGLERTGRGRRSPDGDRDDRR